MSEARHDIYETADGRLVRMVGKNILIRADKPREISFGGIHYATSSVEHVMNTGTILAFGFIEVGGKKGYPHKRFPIPDIEVGDRCVFVRYLSEVHTNKQVQQRIEEGVFRIQTSDILIVYDPEDEELIFR